MTYDDTKFKQHTGTYLAYSVTYTNINLMMYNYIIYKYKFYRYKYLDLGGPEKIDNK